VSTTWLYLLGVLNLASGVYSFLSTLSYLRYAKRAIGKASEYSYRPTVTLLVPCCGEEEGLEDNLRALVGQDYEDLEVIFIVESESDPAVPVIERILDTDSRPARLVVAGLAEGRGQKVHNLSAGIARARETEVLAFADSDGQPDSEWLANLVLPLERTEVGVSTSFRFYLPERGSLASLVRSAWNAAVLTLLGDHNRNFAWGGSMAIRREIFRRAKVEEAWRGALSDDYTLTHAVRRAGYRVEFVPRCLVGSRGPVGLREVLRWCTRQMAITRVYWPNLWRIGGVSQLAFVVFLMLAAPTAVTEPGIALLVAVVLILSWVGGGIKAWAVRLLLPKWGTELRRYDGAYVLLAPVTSFITVYGFLRSAFSRRIEWRGKVYEMRSPTETVILDAATPELDAKAHQIR
jgi:cellulose synthase/poly-beta-1,6-N-acetylglucosamine synthase-like glycosyltransferase